MTVRDSQGRPLTIAAELDDGRAGCVAHPDIGCSELCDGHDDCQAYNVQGNEGDNDGERQG